jgi:hypothetical protein
MDSVVSEVVKCGLGALRCRERWTPWSQQLSKADSVLPKVVKRGLGDLRNAETRTRSTQK